MKTAVLIDDYLRLLNMTRKPRLPPAKVPGGTCMIFAPHPDDECIVGALPLRLQREAGMKIVNVPVTLGSNVDRKPERRAELGEACKLLGFEILEPSAHCFDQVKPDTKLSQEIYWDGVVTKTAALLAQVKPDVIVAPHRLDVHETHIGTYNLVMDALGKMPDDFSVRLAFSEYYQAQNDPNLLVEIPAEDVALLIEAIMCHAGEIARSPYHLRLPAWWIDSARRGEELLGGVAAVAGKIAFASLYEAGLWKAGRYEMTAADIIMPADHSAASLIAVGA